MEIILKYFPDLTEEQRKQFAALYDLYIDWNSKINVISRKDIENLYEHHVLHSLGIAKVIQFRPGTSVMDLGTGGGFPGIPLAILFPETRKESTGFQPFCQHIKIEFQTDIGLAACITLIRISSVHRFRVCIHRTQQTCAKQGNPVRAG